MLHTRGERLNEQAVAVLESVRLTKLGRAPMNARSTRTLGRSQLGRPIRAVRIGDLRSTRRILVVGCLHGDECAGMRVTEHLASLVRPIPFDLWLVPNLNPDGLAAGTRGNARGADLNRDFDTFSQRETRVARALIEEISPDLTIWFHQPQGLVRAWGRSRATARRYARLAGEPYRSLEWPPGSASRWQNGLGQVSFVVELPPGSLPADEQRATPKRFSSCAVGSRGDLEGRRRRGRARGAARRRAGPAPLLPLRLVADLNAGAPAPA